MMTDDPQLPPRWRRNYAHVISLELMCPKCRRIHTTGRSGQLKTNAKRLAYNRLTGIFQCPHPCNYRAYVGVLLWPARGRRARAEDHVPAPGEIAKLRAAREVEALPERVDRGHWSAVTEEKPSGGRGTGPAGMRNDGRAQVNLVCRCGEGCPVHGQVGKEEGEDHD